MNRFIRRATIVNATRVYLWYIAFFSRVSYSSEILEFQGQDGLVLIPRNGLRLQLLTLDKSPKMI